MPFRMLAIALAVCSPIVLACARETVPEPPPAPTPPPAPAPPAPAPASGCGGEGYEIRAAEDGVVELAPDLGLGAAEELWRGDLDGDGRDDRLLRFATACGNYGDCPHAALVACDGDRFRLAWGPEYAFEIAVAGPEDGVGTAAPGDRRPLVELQRRADDRIDRRLLRFVDGEYRAVERPERR